MRKLVGLMTLAAVGLAFATFTAAEGEGEEEKAVDVVAYAEEGGWQFLGVGGCKMCHKSEKSGNQFGKWSEGPHAGAYARVA